MKKLTKEEFIKLAKKKHGNKFDYSKVEYKTITSKVIIVCPTHGEFLQSPRNHILSKTGCRKCSNKEKYTTEEFIKYSSEVHNNKYDYSKVNYISGRIKVLIGCAEHGEFYQAPYVHLQGQGCPKCATEQVHLLQRKTTEQFIKEARLVHGDKYNYSQVDYKGKDIPVIITCQQHGEFYQRPHSHLNGAGCPKCILKEQEKFFNKLKNCFKTELILFEVGKSVIPWINKQRLDIYFPKYNIAVEYDGKQHFEFVSRFKSENLDIIHKRDKQKNFICQQNNCKLFRIKYNYSEQEFKELVTNINTIIYDSQQSSISYL